MVYGGELRREIYTPKIVARTQMWTKGKVINREGFWQFNSYSKGKEKRAIRHSDVRSSASKLFTKNRKHRLLN